MNGLSQAPISVGESLEASARNFAAPSPIPSAPAAAAASQQLSNAPALGLHAMPLYQTIPLARLTIIVRYGTLPSLNQSGSAYETPLSGTGSNSNTSANSSNCTTLVQQQQQAAAGGRAQRTSGAMGRFAAASDSDMEVAAEIAGLRSQGSLGAYCAVSGGGFATGLKPRVFLQTQPLAAGATTNDEVDSDPTEHGEQPLESSGVNDPPEPGPVTGVSSLGAAPAAALPHQWVNINFAEEVVLSAKLAAGGFGQVSAPLPPVLGLQLTFLLSLIVDGSGFSMLHHDLATATLIIDSGDCHCMELCLLFEPFGVFYDPPNTSIKPLIHPAAIFVPFHQVYSGFWRGRLVAVKLVPVLEGAHGGGSSSSLSSILQEVQVRRLTTRYARDAVMPVCLPCPPFCHCFV